ncbi:MAG: DUF3310 domain-containing protein [Fusobacteriaceae bacterium]
MLEKEELTKSKHYESGGADVIDLLHMSGDAEGFIAGSATKYILRRHKKQSYSDDVVKAFDFVTMLLHMAGISKEQAIGIIEKRFARKLNNTGGN